MVWIWPVKISHKTFAAKGLPWITIMSSVISVAEPESWSSRLLELAGRWGSTKGCLTGAEDFSNALSVDEVALVVCILLLLRFFLPESIGAELYWHAIPRARQRSHPVFSPVHLIYRMEHIISPMS